jgi:ABC-type sugar transport system ATPase subunit
MMADHEVGAGADYHARGITKAFAEIAVLRDVTVHFRPGEIHSLIGENGAGKSTLLKIMAGVYPSDAGTDVDIGRNVSSAIVGRLPTI